MIFGKQSLIKYIFILTGLSMLLTVNGQYLMPYILLYGTGMVCVYVNGVKYKESKVKYQVFTYICSVIMGIIIMLANYRLFLENTLPYGSFGWLKVLYMMLNFGIVLGSSSLVFYEIFKLINIRSLSECRNIQTDDESKYTWKPVKVFMLSALLFLIVYLAVFFLCRYPGNWYPDNINQLKQIDTGRYSNHHPVYHTFLIKICMDLGMKLTGSINGAAATYAVFQIIVTALIYAYTVMTMYERRIPVKYIVLTTVIYLLVPYHIIYSFSVTKDALFSVMVLLFTVASIRMLSATGNGIINVIVVFVAGVGVCIFRSNGFIAFVPSVLIFAVLMGRKEKKMLITLLITVIIGFVLKNVVTGSMNIAQPDILESLAVPGQQIARVIVDGGELSDKEYELLGRAIDVERIPDVYISTFFDPVKNLAREQSGQKVIKDNISDYTKLYVALGLRYPVMYLKAWIDETSGYYNGGYSNPTQFSNVCEDNPFGIQREVVSNGFDSLFSDYCHLFSEYPLLQVFISIGAAVWFILILLYMAIITGNRKYIYIISLLVMVWGTLLVATPLSGEFRYILYLYEVIPFVAGMMYFERKDAD